jgi:hypothetical protein
MAFLTIIRNIPANYLVNTDLAKNMPPTIKLFNTNPDVFFNLLTEMR